MAKPPTLWFNISKIQFVRNSQRGVKGCNPLHSCDSISQRYNLFAIHNTSVFYVKIYMLWFNISKIQFVRNSQQIFQSTKQTPAVIQYLKDTICSQFTTDFLRFHFVLVLWFNISKIQFVRNSQPFYLVFMIVNCCDSISQRYNLFAIHNNLRVSLNVSFAVIQYLKDTICSQFTTPS